MSLILDNVQFPPAQLLYTDPGSCNADMYRIVQEVALELAAEGYEAPDPTEFAEDLMRLWREVYSHYAPRV
jgi:hypothetical protein